MTISEFQSRWMEKRWIIQLVDPGYSGVEKGDIVQFTDTPNMAVQIQRTDNSTETWAASIDGDDLIAVRSSDSRAFRLQIDADNTLNCIPSEPAANQRGLAAVALGTLSGGLIGTLIGFAAGSPALGALASLAAALTGSLTTAVSSFANRTTSGGTWVAEEGNGGRGIVGPRPVYAARS
jgi:hypothetical protein